METHITINKSIRGVMHYGSESRYETLSGSHFKKINDPNLDHIEKELIIEIKYKPDSIYNSSDGYGGTCWIAQIISEKGTIYYHFRNMVDLINFYKEKDFKFVKI